jgi:hypothetical protein
LGTDLLNRCKFHNLTDELLVSENDFVEFVHDEHSTPTAVSARQFTGKKAPRAAASFGDRLRSCQTEKTAFVFAEPHRPAIFLSEGRTNLPAANPPEQGQRSKI